MRKYRRSSICILDFEGRGSETPYVLFLSDFSGVRGPGMVLAAESEAQVEPSQKRSCLDPAMQPLLVKKLSDTAKIPVRGSGLAAGYDLTSAHDYVVPARGKALVKSRAPTRQT